MTISSLANIIKAAIEKIVLLLVFMFFFNTNAAQVKVLLLDGNVITTNWLKYNSEDSLFYYKNNQDKYRVIEKECVFSITEYQKSEMILYHPDSILPYSVAEMKELINGQIYAKANYHPYWLLGTSVIVGTAGTLIPYSQGINMFHASFIPLAYTGYYIFGGIKPKSLIIPIDCANVECYKYGYQVKAKKRRFIYVALGAFVGTSIGFLTYTFQYH